MLRQLLPGRAVAVTLCRTGLLFDLPFAVYISHGSALITWGLETGPSEEGLWSTPHPSPRSPAGGAPPPRSPLSTVAPGVQDLEAALRTSKGCLELGVPFALGNCWDCFPTSPAAFQAKKQMAF